MDFVNQFIPNDFPIYNQVNGPNLVAFIQAYYEWLEQSGNIRDYGNNLRNYRDSDDTLQEFMSHFQYEYLNSLPADIVVNKQLLIKHVLDLYRAKGTRRGIALLFRILFNEDISIYLPGNDIFKTSAATWVRGTYIEVSDSAFLPQLLGNSIYSLNGGATALVENYNIVRTANKVINILYLSNVVGSFIYGDSIMADDISYTPSQAPHIVGSLSSVSIENGGAFFNVGDIVSIEGTGSGALGRISSTTSQNGKVTFNLNEGGFGFTMNAVVQVIPNGSGTGATFSVGSLTNQTNYLLNTDIINTYYNEQLDVASSGFELIMANHTGGVFLAGETVNCVCSNSVDLDFYYISGAALQQFETLSNTSLGISVEPIIIDNPSFVRVIGTDTNLNLLAGGQNLISSVSNCIIHVNSVIPKQINITNGVIQTVVNTSAIIISGANDGYPMPTSKVTGLTSGATANVQSVIRETNWGFPINANSCLDTPISICLTWVQMTIGTIASLKNQNPGNFYNSNPTVIITEPTIATLAINDGTGGIWGADANVTANAAFANGIVTSVQIISSGFGFAKGETLEMSIANNAESIQAIAICEGTGIAEGYWSTNPSGTSSTSHILDSYFYQDYSYEIIAGRDLSTYQSLVENLMGPLGYVIFGEYLVTDTQNTTSVIEFGNMTKLSN